MKRVTYSEKSMILGDEAAETLLEYARVLATTVSADTVEVAALDHDGDAVMVTFLLGPATIMMAETTRSARAEPDNAEPIAYMRRRIEFITNPPNSQPQRGESEAPLFVEEDYLDSDDSR